MTSNNLRVLIVAEHASVKFGGEAALPLHYFRVLRKRNIETWLVVHERTRDELQHYFAHDFDRIHFIADTFWHRLLWQLSQRVPQRLAYFTVGFLLRLLTQIAQRCVVKTLVKQHHITVVHQPTPVSPKEPSLIFDVGAPVVIGPMNGGMDYPPAFQRMQSRLVHWTLAIGRVGSDWLNWLFPGKQRATTLLVANARTKAALPKRTCHQIVTLPENGVDLAVWQPQRTVAESPLLASIETAEAALPKLRSRPIRFVFVGRLVHWKAVDLLLIAFQRVLPQVSVELEIIGDGPEGDALKQQAAALGLLEKTGSPIGPQADESRSTEGPVKFSGWLSQVECARRLQQSDVLVLPSMLECGGAAVLEAMTMGIPVIATNWGGPADYLDESCGILVDPQSWDGFIADLAAAMVRMALSPELRRSMGQAGRKRVLRYFDWDVKATTILEIYRNMLTATAHQQVVSQKVVGGVIS